MSKWAVFSGGGSKGAAQVGMLRSRLDAEPDLDYSGYAGISVGALNSAFLSQGKLDQTLPLLEEIWFKKIKGNRSIWLYHLYYYLALSAAGILLSFGLFITALVLNWWVASALLGLIFLASFYLPYFVLTKTKSIYNASPLSKLVYENYHPVNTMMANKTLLVGAVSWKKGIYEVANQDNRRIHEWVLASSAFPVFLTNRYINGLFYTDGGIREIAPLRDAIEHGATEVDVYLASPLEMCEDEENLPSLPDQVMRLIEIMSNEILRNDLLEISRLNPGVKIRIFMPKKKLTSNSLSFDPKLLRYMYEEGKKIGKDPLTIGDVSAIIFGC